MRGRTVTRTWARHACRRWTLADHPDSLVRARALTRITLEAVGLPKTTVDDAVLIVSELVANALNHASGPYELRLCADRETGVMGQVIDGGPHPIAFARHANQAVDVASGAPSDVASDPLDVLIECLAERGRGLGAVAALSSGCGSHPLADDTRDHPAAKLAWFVLPSAQGGFR